MKKILCCLLAVLLLLPLWSYAEPAAALTVSAVEGTPGESVELTLSLQNNPGIAGLAVSLQYDKSVLTLTGSKRGSLFSGFTAGKNFAWDESENVTEDGVLATFTFTVSESAAAGEYPVQAVVRSCTNEDFDDVALATVSGCVTVKVASEPTPDPTPVVDPDVAAIIVEQVKAQAGATVPVTLSLQNNPGIAGLAVSLQYDKSVLTLTGSKRGSLFSGFTAGKNFAWDESENVTEDGVLATFTFAVSESAAAGEYSVQAVVRSCTNEDFDDVALLVIPGSITVSAAPEFTEISGTLSSDVGLNFHTDTQAASVVFTWNGGDKTAEVTGTAEGGGFRYTCPLSAKEMDAAVTAEIKDASGNTVDTFTYSMAEYLQSLTVANGYTQATETLAQATLDYGAAAKAYFLGGAEVSPAAVTEPLTTYFDKASMTTEDGDISYYGRSLLLKDVTFLRLYFTAQSAPAVRVDGKAWEIKASSTAGYYMVDIPVGPAALGGSYAVTVDGTDIAFSVGVNDYIATALEERAADDPLAELCRALYWYGAAAEAYAAE